ncbi:hypothetical protein [Pedobacter faecalis]|uniref:hypothetical protein n=1 Tax=Pedobacter faecalis TaxID=3041495 RepID=UPI00254AACCE|nr:hypothetical protein [Pedobacter sp. ELA7]
MENEKQHNSSLPSDGPVSNSEMGNNDDLTGALSPTDPKTAGDDSTDEDAADPEMAANDTSKGFDRDQEALDLGLDDGDLDNDVPKGS